MRKILCSIMALMLIMVIFAFIFPKGRDGVFFSIVLLLSLIFTYHRTYDFFVLVAVYGGIRELKHAFQTAIA